MNESLPLEVDESLGASLLVEDLLSLFLSFPLLIGRPPYNSAPNRPCLPHSSPVPLSPPPPCRKNLTATTIVAKFVKNNPKIHVEISPLLLPQVFNAFCKPQTQGVFKHALRFSIYIDLFIHTNIPLKPHFVSVKTKLTYSTMNNE